MIKRKKLPKKRQKGLQIYCSKCRKYFSYTQKDVKISAGEIKTIEPKCGEPKTKFSRCPNFGKHKYKAIVHLSGTKSRKVSKSLSATKYDDAVIQTIEFKKEIEQEIQAIPDVQENQSKSAYLWDVQLEYIDFLDNEGVPDHKRVKRFDKHIKEQMKCLHLFNESLEKNKINKKTLVIHRVMEEHVGYFHTYLLDDKEYRNKTYNNKMVSVKSFFEWAIKKYKLKISNPFDGTRQRSVTSKIETITGKEFNDLINPKNMNYDNGWNEDNLKSKKRRNFYRDFLSKGLQLCLHTGGRREEVVELTWDMINEIDGELAFIEIRNLKVERSVGDGYNDNVAASIVPVTSELRNLLYSYGYEVNRGASEYILCPDRSKISKETIMTNLSKETIMTNLSKGFSYFYKRLNTGRQLQMKCLRKTYLTYLNKALKGDAAKLSSHTTNAVLSKHYIDKRIIDSAVSEMTIFGD